MGIQYHNYDIAIPSHVHFEVSLPLSNYDSAIPSHVSFDVSFPLSICLREFYNPPAPPLKNTMDKLHRFAPGNDSEATLTDMQDLSICLR
jgi:hypothetical protein